MKFTSRKIVIGGALERRMDDKLSNTKKRATIELGNLAYKHMDGDWGMVLRSRRALNEMALKARRGIAISIFQLEGIYVRISTIFGRDGPETTLGETTAQGGDQ